MRTILFCALLTGCASSPADDAEAPPTTIHSTMARPTASRAREPGHVAPEVAQTPQVAKLDAPSPAEQMYQLSVRAGGRLSYLGDQERLTRVAASRTRRALWCSITMSGSRPSREQHRRAAAVRDDRGARRRAANRQLGIRQAARVRDGARRGRRVHAGDVPGSWQTPIASDRPRCDVPAPSERHLAPEPARHQRHARAGLGNRDDRVLAGGHALVVERRALDQNRIV